MEDRKILYKVLQSDMSAPVYEFKYEIGKEYHCGDFDVNPRKDCSRGFYATDFADIQCMFTSYDRSRVFECEVWGISVEFNKYKRRYENIKIIREIPSDELKQRAKAEEETLGYKLHDILFPIFRYPEKFTTKETLTSEIEYLTKLWIQLRNNIIRNIYGEPHAIEFDTPYGSKFANDLLKFFEVRLDEFTLIYIIDNKYGKSKFKDIYDVSLGNVVHSIFHNISYDTVCDYGNYLIKEFAAIYTASCFPEIRNDPSFTACDNKDQMINIFDVTDKLVNNGIIVGALLDKSVNYRTPHFTLHEQREIIVDARSGYELKPLIYMLRADDKEADIQMV